MATVQQGDQEPAWIRRAQGGDREAFGLLVGRYERRVFALVFRLVRRREDLEDIVQEIFLKAFLGIRKYNFKAAFGTWLARVAVNHCYDYLRHQRISKVTYYSEFGEPGERALEENVAASRGDGVRVEEQAEALDLARKLLGRASAADRVVLTLKELEGLSVQEIAEILNLNASTVKVRIHRARKRMLEDLKRWRKEER